MGPNSSPFRLPSRTAVSIPLFAGNNQQSNLAGSCRHVSGEWVVVACKRPASSILVGEVELVQSHIYIYIYR